MLHLVHHDLKQQTTKPIMCHIQSQKHVFQFLHAPKATIREAPLRSIKKLLIICFLGGTDVELEHEAAGLSLPL